MSEVRLQPMHEPDLTAWRQARAAEALPLPVPTAAEEQEAVTVVVDGVEVGGMLLGYLRDGERVRCAVRVLQTTLPLEATDSWVAVVTALETHVRARGVATLEAAIEPGLVPAFGTAGFQATMLTVSMPVDPVRRGSEFDGDRRVALRPMSHEERVRFVASADEMVCSGMARAGVVDPGSSRLDVLDGRLESLLADPPPAHELVLMAVVDGVPVGTTWATLTETDGVLDFYGNTLEIFPEHRGQGLSKSLAGALLWYLDGLGVRGISGRVYAHDRWARGLAEPSGDVVDDVHVRKDLR